MEGAAAAVALVLLFTVLGSVSTSSFYGDSLSFMPLKRNRNGTFSVTYHHRQSGRGSCVDQSSFTCEENVCAAFNKSSAQSTDYDATGQGRWCQTEGYTTLTVSTNDTSFSLRGSGCCWISNINGQTNWTSVAELDLGTRSDSQSINNCPVTAAVSLIRVPQNCFNRIPLLAHDPDGDKVKCSFISGSSAAPNITLDQATCTLNRVGDVPIGVQVFELRLEDFPTKNITMRYANGTSVLHNRTQPASLCKVKLQFTVEVLAPVPRCEVGHVQPVFLSRTPSQGEVLHATVGQTFKLYAQAQASHSTINEFQVSGPWNMTKLFKDDVQGKAEVTMEWTPQQSDLHRLVPICFTAETNETQSEMRCVVVTVIRSAVTDGVIEGKAAVQCLPNKMTVTLERASMPGIDERFLQLMDPSCSLTSNSTHITGSMSFTACGTKMEDTGDFIQFKNEIDSFELPNSVITRRRRVKIGFSCQFSKIISISNYFNIYRSDYIFTESSFGSFGYTFEIFRDSNFTTKVEAKAYPVEVKLLDMIYMGIQAQSELPSVTLFVESCKATPDDNPDNPLNYDLIKDGCLKDETIKVSPSNETVFNFEIQAFKFTGNLDQVYITCSVIMCQAGSPFSRCARGCLPPASRRRRRATDKETASHYITQGPLKFSSSFVPSADVEENSVILRNDHAPAEMPPPVSSNTESSEETSRTRQVLGTNISTIFLGCAFMLSVVTMAVVIHYFSKIRKREDDRRALIISDKD